MPKFVKFNFKPGDHVRISKVKGTFEKGYQPNWSEEIFMIAMQKKTMPPMYTLRDHWGEPILGAFYEPELQKITQLPKHYHVERIIKTRTNSKTGKMQYLVKWMGYGDNSNSWVDTIEGM